MVVKQTQKKNHPIGLGQFHSIGKYFYLDISSIDVVSHRSLRAETAFLQSCVVRLAPH